MRYRAFAINSSVSRTAFNLFHVQRIMWSLCLGNLMQTTVVTKYTPTYTPPLWKKKRPTHKTNGAHANIGEALAAEHKNKQKLNKYEMEWNESEAGILWTGRWDEKPTQSTYKYWPEWITCSFIYIVHVRHCVFSCIYMAWATTESNRRIDMTTKQKWNWTIFFFVNPKYS